MDNATEQYERDTPDCPETIQPGSNPITPESKGFQRLKFFVLFCCVALVAGVLALLVVAVSGVMITDGTCDEMVINATNESFINGTMFGIEYAVASLTEEAIQCKQIPMNYQNYSYTLIAAECLNLNETQEVK